MNEVMMLRGAEPREILEKIIEKKTPAIMSYLAGGKWHVAKVQLTGLGAERLDVQVLPEKRPQPVDIRVDQPVGISLKYGYGKFIFDTSVTALKPSLGSAGGGTVVLAVPCRIEVVERRSYFRVNVPRTLRVNVMLWRRRGLHFAVVSKTSAGCHTAENCRAGESQGSGSDDRRVMPVDYWEGRLVDISAGGAQIAVDAAQSTGRLTAGSDIRKGQFIGLRFTPMPYERPLMFNAQIRNVLPTADGKNICLGLQIVGLEASPEGRAVLQRLCNVVERYYQINQSSARQQDMQPASAFRREPVDIG
jgi:hypothetical protein